MNKYNAVQAQIHAVHRPDMPLILLDYEIRSSLWCTWIGYGLFQELAGKYFAWKVRTKYKRWQQSIAEAQRLKALYG